MTGNCGDREAAAALKEIEGLFAHWQQLLDTNGDKEELDWVTKEIQEKLKGITYDLEDLHEAVSTAQANPARFNVRLAVIFILKKKSFFFFFD